jgi:hypothetical protein
MKSIYQWPITILLVLLSPLWGPLFVFGLMFSIEEFHGMVWNKNE